MDVLLLEGLPVLAPSIGLIFWTTLIFLVTWFILGKFAFKPISEALKKREETIDSALKSAEEAEVRMKELTAQNEQIIKEARIEKQAILAEAKTQSDKIVAEAKEKANEESAKLLAQAKSEIDSQKLSVMNDIKNQTGDLAIQIAEQLVKKELASDSAQDQLVSTLIEQTSLN